VSALRTRDLASHDLWERSLHRSRERRRITAIHRKNAPRRKGVSLAISAALLTTPILPSFAAAQSGGGPAPTSGTGPDDQGRPAPPKSLLKIGSSGEAVKQIQRALGLIDDGIYGPQTREAVLRFQRHARLAPTGKVDNGTWMAIFSSNVTVLDAGTPEADAVQSAAGDVPLEAAPTTTTATPASLPAKDEDPSGAEPAVFTSSTTDSETDPSDTSTTPKRTKSTRKRSRGDDSGSTPRRERPRSDRNDSGDSGGSRKDKPASSDDGGNNDSAGCGGFGKPVNGTTTGVFGESRGSRSHAGVDIAAPSGTPIKAATCGRVTTVESQGGYGNIVCIRASSSFTTCYAHMSRFGTSVGEYVRIGEVIGYVGCTGSCTGPHVHFEVRLNGTQVDPAPYLNGSRKPGRTMGVRYTSAHDKGSDEKATPAAKKTKKKDEPVDTATIVEDQRDANREAGGVPAPPKPTPEQQQPTTQAAPPAGQPAAPPAGDPAAPPADDGTAVPVDDGSGVVDDGSGVVDDGSGVVDDGSGVVDDGSGVVEDTTGTVDETVDDTGLTDDGTTDDGSEDYTDDGTTDDSGYTDDGTTDDGSGVVEDTTDPVEDTVDDTTGEDASGDDGSSDDGSGVVEDTTEPVEDTVGETVDDTTGEDTSGEEPAVEEPVGEDTSGDDTSGDDTSGEDTSGGEDPAGEEPSVTEDPAGAVEDTVEDTTGAPAGG
jgi:murein DD-endopeptidase MepM/ murein hydrolase activator NlpD